MLAVAFQILHFKAFLETCGPVDLSLMEKMSDLLAHPSPDAMRMPTARAIDVALIDGMTKTTSKRSAVPVRLHMKIFPIEVLKSTNLWIF